MGVRFRKSAKLPGGGRVNFSKSGIGGSVGTKGFRVTKMASGSTRTTTSIPGSGVSYVRETSGKANTQKSGLGLYHLILSASLVIIVICSMILLFTSCSGGKKHQDGELSPPILTESTAPEVSPTANTDNEKVKEYLSELGFEVVSTKSSGAIVEFMITLDGFSDQDLSEPPVDWGDIYDSVLSAAAGMTDEDFGLIGKNIVLYLQDNTGSNYLTISNGKETYSAFKTYSTDVFNPSTITMEEYNAIRTGMTFQEVYDIIGGAGEVTQEYEANTYHSITQEWQGTGEFVSYASITFEDGKVRSKYQYGLE